MTDVVITDSFDYTSEGDFLGTWSNEYQHPSLNTRTFPNSDGWESVSSSHSFFAGGDSDNNIDGVFDTRTFSSGDFEYITEALFTDIDIGFPDTSWGIDTYSRTMFTILHIRVQDAGSGYLEATLFRSNFYSGTDSFSIYFVNSAFASDTATFTDVGGSLTVDSVRFYYDSGQWKLAVSGSFGSSNLAITSTGPSGTNFKKVSLWVETGQAFDLAALVGTDTVDEIHVSVGEMQVTGYVTPVVTPPSGRPTYSSSLTGTTGRNTTTFAPPGTR